MAHRPISVRGSPELGCGLWTCFPLGRLPLAGNSLDPVQNIPSAFESRFHHHGWCLSMRRSPFDIQDEEHGDPSYRVIPLEPPPKALCVKHHLGLVGAGEGGDTNHLLPLRIGRQLQQEGIIGALSAEHYSFMGYIPHIQPLIERTAAEVALRLRAEQVNAAILIPV